MSQAGHESKVRFELSLPSVAGSCRKARLVASEICKDASLSPTSEYRILLAVDELCQNVIHYAYGGPTDQQNFQIVFEYVPGCVWAEVRDEGCGFDEALLEPIEAGSQDLESLMYLEQRGLALVGALMDSREIQSGPGGGTTVRISLNQPT
ncbi:MAG: hypothetical protein GF320_04245 [Armatimonadia bacterium]|nr:hypothetical protein [Armatimonadia bacterium]